MKKPGLLAGLFVGKGPSHVLLTEADRIKIIGNQDKSFDDFSIKNWLCASLL